MKELSINQYREFAYLNKEITEKVIKERRKAIQEANGKKPSNNISSKALITLNAIFNMILETGVNELFVPKQKLTEILETTKNNTNRDVKTYFKGYGLGEYSYSNKYNITINGKSKSVTRETHYYIYINKETLELMKSVIKVEGVDFDTLIEQIPDCEYKCNIIGNKTETQINILNYVDDDFIMEHKINVEKNLFTKEGHYSKETNIINTEDNSVVELSKKENDFIPKEKEDIKETFELHTEEKPYCPLDKFKNKKVVLSGADAFYTANQEKPEEEEEEEEVEEELPEEEIFEETNEELLKVNIKSKIPGGAIRRHVSPKLSGGRR